MNGRIASLSAQEVALSRLIQQARAERYTVAGKDTSRGVDLAGAYRIQAWNRGERIIKGYKLGLISPAKQAQMGIATPLYGPVYADMLRKESVDLKDFLAPRLEPEIALVLRKAVQPEDDAESISRAIGGYHLGVDILDSVWTDYKFTAAEVVADNTSGGAFVLAGEMHPTLGSGLLRLYLNGELRTEGHTDDLGSPPQQLKWLASQVGELAAGAIIFLGSPAASIPATAGTLKVTGPGGGPLTAQLLD